MIPVILHLLLVAFGLFIILTTLPLVLELLVLSVAAMLPYESPQPSTSTTFRVAVIIPAHNEEHLIAACIRSLLISNNPALSIYVIAHNCSDRTALCAEQAGAISVTLNDSVGGKGLALDFGIRHAIASGAEGVLIIDADSIVSPDLVRAVSSTLAAGAGAVQCRYQVSNADTNQRTRIAALAFLGMDVLRPLGRSRLGLSCGIFGNGFALSASTLASVPYVANSIVEDLEYHLHLIRAGIVVKFLNHVSVFAEMPETSAAANSQSARWEGGRILMRRLWTRPLLLKVLRGDLRMLEPLLDLLALPLATEAALLLVTAMLSLLSHLPWLTVYASVGLASVFLYPLAAASLAPNPRRSVQALVSAPAYLFWKLLLIPRTHVAARAGSTWVRTRRNAEAVNPPLE